jgi:N-succinyldiaminopimelate aminotransferase
MNPDLARLQPYPFQRLANLFAGLQPDPSMQPISLSIGEPKHPTPGFITEAVIEHLHGLSSYPVTKGSAALRETIAHWLQRRFSLNQVDPEHQVLPVSGTREALFALAQAVVDRRRDPIIAMPNPFYQIYEGAALLAGAEPRYLNCTAENSWLPDLDAVSAADWQRCQLLYLCSPGNPTGAIMSIEYLQHALELAERHDFIIAADECYSEIYLDEANPPPGLLQAAQAAGNDRYRRCIVFHSLSKRSNVPGMRSGFVAGDAQLMERFLLYRTYQGCALPPAHQAASAAAWSDEAHVADNRQRYRAKFDAVLEILSPVLEVTRPEAGFYLWPQVPSVNGVRDEQAFAQRLYRDAALHTLPGSFLSREANGLNPGAGRLRMALVAELDECVEAAQRIAKLCA